MFNFLKTLATTAEDLKLSPDKIGLPALGANGVLGSVLNIVYIVAGVVCVITIIIAGFVMVVSGQTPDAIARARMWILYSAVGIVVVAIAFMITNFLIGKF